MITKTNGNYLLISVSKSNVENISNTFYDTIAEARTAMKTALDNLANNNPDAISNIQSHSACLYSDSITVAWKIIRVTEPIIIFNVDWDISFDEVIEKLDTMTVKDATDFFEVPYSTYANMTTEERHDYAYSEFHHSPARLEEFFGLPNKITVPDEIIDFASEANNKDEIIDCITEWLSDEYGFCFNWYTINID